MAHFQKLFFLNSCIESCLSLTEPFNLIIDSRISFRIRASFGLFWNHHWLLNSEMMRWGSRCMHAMPRLPVPWVELLLPSSICSTRHAIEQARYDTKMIAEATWFDLELTPSSCYKEGLKIPLTLYISTLTISSSPSYLPPFSCINNPHAFLRPFPRTMLA